MRARMVLQRMFLFVVAFSTCCDSYFVSFNSTTPYSRQSRSISLTILLQAVPFTTRITSCSFKKLLIVSKGDAKRSRDYYQHLQQHSVPLKLFLLW